MKEGIIKWAREAAEYADAHTNDMEPNDDEWSALRDKRFAELVEDAQAKRMHAEGMVTVGHMRQQIAAERNKVASWMMTMGYATGHGDTTEDLLDELDWQITESWSKVVVASIEAEREACAKVCEDKNTLLAWPTYAVAIRARGTNHG
jgi:hypothetical protein